jgi:hypothetical protein
MKRFKRLLRLVAGTALLAGLLVAPAASVSAHEGDSLSAVRHATARFHSVPAAHAAGYFDPGLPCFDKPGVGGMGTHLVNLGLVNGTVSPTHPQALVYEVDGDELTLVAVEYLVPDNLPEPAPLFGQHFHHAYLPHGGASLHLWALHAWVWRHNPLGMFADYNPRVDLCPGTPSDD